MQRQVLVIQGAQRTVDIARMVFGGLRPDGETQATIEYVPKVVRLIPQERVQQRTVEQIVHVPVPQVVEEVAEVVQTIPRSVSRSVSQTEPSMCQL